MKFKARIGNLDSALFTKNAVITGKKQNLYFKIVWIGSGN